MLYLTCPTCGYFLGNKTYEFETKKKIICDNPKLSKKQEEQEIEKLIQKLKIRRYCCKMRIISYKDIIEDILPIPKNT